MTKTEAMKIARQAKPEASKWATQKDVELACWQAGVNAPSILDGSDLWTLKAIAEAIQKANA